VIEYTVASDPFQEFLLAVFVDRLEALLQPFFSAPSLPLAAASENRWRGSRKALAEAVALYAVNLRQFVRR